MNVHWKKSINKSEGKPEQKFDVAFETIFRISECMFSKKHAKTAYIFFFYRQAKILNHLRMYRKY
jgi:hypothetical protein